jgi:hypothetical protein
MIFMQRWGRIGTIGDDSTLVGGVSNASGDDSQIRCLESDHAGWGGYHDAANQLESALKAPQNPAAVGQD